MPFILDTFTDANDTLLTAHTGERGASWAPHPAAAGTFAITANRARSTGATGSVIASGVPPTPDYAVSVSYYVADQVSNNAAVLIRLDATALTGYMARLSSTSRWQLHRYSAGSATLLDEEVASVTNGTTYILRVAAVGARISVAIDGATIIDITDASPVTPAGRVGLRDTGSVSSTTGKHFDRIEASTIEPSRAFPVLQIGSSHVGPLRVGKD
jgi:hypothetical protein